MRGGLGTGSGTISIGGRAERVSIAGDVVGTTSGTARISTGMRLGSLEIGGSLIAGEGFYNALIDGGSIGEVHIHGSILNTRTIFASETPANPTGALMLGSLGSLTVDGSISAAPGQPAAAPVTSYALIVSGKVGSIAVGGELEGTAENRIGLAAGALVILGGGSYGNEPAPSAAGFDHIRIGGSVQFAEINAGTMSDRVMDGRYVGNPDAHIGSIIAKGSWTASTITAGTQPGADGDYGTSDDLEVLSAIGAEATARNSWIGSVVIAGHVTGTPTAGDHFAIQAQRIGSASISGAPLRLTTSADSFELAPRTGDLKLRELRS